MTDICGQNITQMLQAWRRGDKQALDRLTPEVYRGLHRAAKRCMREERHRTLQTTALVNELYLRLDDLQRVDWQSRAHFFALCARQMRQILIDMARSRQSQKRGGRAPAISLDDAPEVSSKYQPYLIAVDEALKALAMVDERKSQVVEMRFFGGLSVEEIAEVLKVSPETVSRDWRLAKAWLRREISGKNHDAS